MRDVLIWAAVVIFFAICILGPLTGQSLWKCPWCRRGIKFGADVCGSCGRETRRPRSGP